MKKFNHITGGEILEGPLEGRVEAGLDVCMHKFLEMPTDSKSAGVVDWAKKEGLYFSDVSDLIAWITAAPMNCEDAAVSSAFSSLQEFKQLIEATSSYEINLDYIVSSPSFSHSYAGISGLNSSIDDCQTLFFTAYALPLENARVFVNQAHINQILEEIGVIGGSGSLVIVKGNENSVSLEHRQRFNYGKLSPFAMHTHSKGPQNCMPSITDYVCLRQQLHFGEYGRKPLAASPAYLSLPESRPLMGALELEDMI